jgi:hypothetical protein
MESGYKIEVLDTLSYDDVVNIGVNSMVTLPCNCLSLDVRVVTPGTWCAQLCGLLLYFYNCIVDIQYRLSTLYKVFLSIHMKQQNAKYVSNITVKLTL